MDKQKQSEQSKSEGGQSVPASATSSQMRQGDVYKMSFRELDAFVDGGVSFVDLHEQNISEVRKALRPAILRMRDALSRQGKRTDLPGVPDKLTFDAWVRNKAGLGSRATIYRLLADAGMPQRKQLAKDARVKDAITGEAGVVTHVHELDGGVPKADVLFEGEKKAETCLAEKLVRVTFRRIAVGDLLVFEDKKGFEYRYEGGGKLAQTAAPLKSGQRKPCGKAKAGQAKAAAAGQRA